MFTLKLKKRKELEMNKITFIIAFTLILSIVAPTGSMALEPHREQLRDGSVINQFCISSYESKRIREEFGYNWKVADRIVLTLFREANIPSTFTAKVGYSVALFSALSGTAYLVWDQAMKHNNNTCWCLRYHTYPHQLKLVDNTLGKIGDKIMPLGEGAKIVIDVMNEILNTVTTVGK